MVQQPATPNPSLKRSANGRPPGPVWRYAVHFRQPGPGVLPLALRLSEGLGVRITTVHPNSLQPNKPMKVFVISGMLLLAGCQTVSQDAPTFTDAPSPPEGYATVYLYRLNAPPYTGLIGYRFSGKEVLATPEKAYTWIHAKAGTHQIYAQWPPQPGWKSTSTTLTVEGGQSYFVRAEGRVGLLPAPGPQPFSATLTSTLTIMQPALGRAELLSCCRYMRSSIQVID